MAKIVITWEKSGIGYPRDQRRTLRALGLHRLHKTVRRDENPSIMGMVHKVRHLVTAERDSDG